MKPEDVHEGVERAVKRARDGGGPTLLEIKTYRYKGHSMSDPAKYRTKEELEEFKLKDPIEHVLNIIRENNYATEAEIEEINNKIKAEIDDCVEFAENSPYPDVSEVYKDIYLDESYPFILD
jgi:pyruvate dehydrogenase E1 component alpha subunit